MQNFTGFYKRIIAGMGCALGIFFISHYTFAKDVSVAQTSTEKPAVVSAVDAQGTTASSVTEPVAATAPVYSSSAKSIVIPAKTNSASQLASLAGGLALILVLIYGLSWFVKRFSQGGFLQNPTMKIVASMPLGTRERLMLVDVGGKQLLLGVTATQINTLQVFDEPVVQMEKNQPIASDFSQKLMAVLQQKNMSSSGVTSSSEDADKKSKS